MKSNRSEFGYITYLVNHSILAGRECSVVWVIIHVLRTRIENWSILRYDVTGFTCTICEDYQSVWDIGRLQLLFGAQRTVVYNKHLSHFTSSQYHTGQKIKKKNFANCCISCIDVSSPVTELTFKARGTTYIFYPGGAHKLWGNNLQIRAVYNGMEKLYWQRNPTIYGTWWGKRCSVQLP